LGIETLGGVMTVLIPSNTTIPTKKSETFLKIRKMLYKFVNNNNNNKNKEETTTMLLSISSLCVQHDYYQMF
jgi:molecular chaperone DnaK (HSP70)